MNKLLNGTLVVGMLALQIGLDQVLHSMPIFRDWRFEGYNHLNDEYWRVIPSFKSNC